MKDRFSKVLESIPPSGIRAFFDLVQASDNVISLGVGEPDFSTPWTIREEAIYRIEKGQTTYTSNMGDPELRAAISEYQDQRFSNHYDPSTEILVTNGVSEGADLVLRSILNPGDEVIIPEPMYVCYDPLVRLAGGEVVTVNTSQSRFVPTPELIEQNITKRTKMIILCYPNNPTGMSIDQTVLEAIAKLAIRHDLWVISDEIYAELSYGKPFVSIASFPGMKERTIVLSGFSKAFAMTGWRVGYVCAEPELISRACKIHQYSALCCSSISQKAAIEALRHSRGDVKEMVESYHQRGKYFVSELNKMGLETLSPEGAFYCFPSIRKTGMDAMSFAMALLKAENVAVVPGNAFGKDGEGYIRCCYASSLSDLKEALARIQRFLSTLEK